MAKDPNQFILDLLRAVRDATGARRPPAWTSVQKVEDRLGIGNAEALDIALRLAGRKGWLRSDGDPASSVSLTVEGMAVLETAPKT
ncbi:MAG: hypothetical protein U1E23_15265 [Reyranellaceae bacterium]